MGAMACGHLIQYSMACGHLIQYSITAQVSKVHEALVIILHDWFPIIIVDCDQLEFPSNSVVSVSSTTEGP